LNIVLKKLNSFRWVSQRRRRRT